MRQILFSLLLFAARLEATTYYISPSGNDGNDGLSSSAPKKTFSAVFAAMSAGDTLNLMDGTYSVAAATGVISYSGANSGQIPSGSSTSVMTTVQAVNAGAVIVQGSTSDVPLFIGRSFRKDSYIKVQGITFKNNNTNNGLGAAHLYNTSYVTIKDCGFQGAFSVGTNDHENGNTDNLIEDVWIWADQQRLIASNYRADENIWRRVVIRGDGCGVAACQGSGNPNVGITIYDSADVSLQNVILIDRILDSGDFGYSDFACAQHTPDAHLFGRNSWLGTMSINAPDGGYNCEVDQYILGQTSLTVRNAVGWASASTTMNVGSAMIVDIANITLAGDSGAQYALRVYDDPTHPTGTVQNVEVAGSSTIGVLVGAATLSYCNVSGPATPYHGFSVACSNASTFDALSDGSLLYLPRIEAGSNLSGAGAGGADKGANIVYRYGIDGTRFGDTGYNGLTVNNLWPWPNETRIKQEMCTDSGITRGFCAGTQTLTDYIWGYLGNGVPGEDPPVITTTQLPNGVTGTAYSQDIQVSGGVRPLASCSLTAGTLPTGTAFALNGDSSGCVLSGTPTAGQGGTYAPTLTVTDGDTPGVTDDQAYSWTVTEGAATLSLREPIVMQSDTAAIVTTGAFGLPYEASCTFVLRNASGQQLSSQTSTSGFAVRTSMFTSLTAATNYRVDVGCDNATPDEIQYPFTTLATPSGGARTIPISLNPSAILSTVDNVIIEYDDNAALSTPATAGPTSCGSGCTPTLSLTAGFWWWRVKWRDSGNNVLATSAIQAVLVQ